MLKKACLAASIAAVSLGAVVFTASAEARTVSRDSYYAYGDSQTDPRYPTSDFDSKDIHYGPDGSCMGWQCDF